ncbi:hypothetical protein S7711_02348 [Stachybotrys chartarum IBT 7711]|uniref:Peptidase M14 domain-containing protein n=1 Tax=Stachybotrys chartarum (strain CBS 109288 / IBT 7711) TaxID=1280523 RepID=A0A084B112_STACB|nr:hypothetical protein S7711_02348 [Stachybotrys chartarum IBT 7711]
MIHGALLTQRVCAIALLASVVAAQSGGIQTGLRYGENWLPTVRDSDLVAANFPNVNITLRSPAFLRPETVPARFSNGTEGPTDDIELDYFIRNLAQRNTWLTYESAPFQSEEGRAIPYLFLSLPDSGGDKLRVYIQAAIHGNEPAADQSVLAFLGKLDAEPSWARSILETMDIKILPRYNVDGVAYFQRQLASNYDPNREHIKLMRWQSRNIKGILSEWSPHIALDMHEYTASTIYGGHYQHGSDALLSGGINPNIHPDIREQLLDVFIPTIGERLESRGLRWEPYVTGASNSTEGSRISFTEAVTEARTGRNAVGLTQTISFLLEMRGIRLADQHFQRRVATALTTIEAILELARDNAEQVKHVVETAREEFIESDEDIVVTDYYVPENRTFTLIDTRDGSVVQVPIDFQRTTPSIANLTRSRPEAYIIPRTWIDIAERLEILGVEVQRLNYEFKGAVEALTVETSSVDTVQYEGQYLNTVTTTSTSREILLPVGSFYVSTRQKNAALAFIALEPENIDSYVTFNIIPLTEGEEYPVFRIPRQKGIKAAIIDTGIYYTHPAFGGCFGEGCLVRNGYDVIGDALIMRGHRMHVAGIIAPQENERGFAGAAPGATVAAYRVFAGIG